MLYHDHFSPCAWKILDPEFVHKLANQEYSPSGNIQEIFFGQRVRHRTRIESLSLISNVNFEPIRKDHKLNLNFLAGVFLVAVANSVDNRFVHGHLDLETGFLVESCRCRNTTGDSPGNFDVLELAFEDNLDNASVRLHSW